MSKISSCAKDIYKILNYLAMPYQFGFIEGHDYLNKFQISQLKHILNSDSADSVILEYETKFSSLIGQGFGVSFAAGRMAFYVLLKTLNIGPGDEVILPGFTCSVMPNAIWRAGAEAVFADIKEDNFGPDSVDIERKITSKTKLIVAQHSFGIPCDIDKISDIAKKHNIFLLEDSAIALSSSYKGVKIGNWGDAAMFSTDHSKPINTLIGGFLYTKDKLLHEKIKKISTNLPHLSAPHQKRLFRQLLFEAKYYNPRNYPRSFVINSVYSILERFGFNFNRLSNFLEDDYERRAYAEQNYPYPAKMPSFLAQVGLFELERWDKNREKRRRILKKYVDIMSNSKLKEYLPRAYSDPKLDITPLRFIFTHPDSKRIMNKMNKVIDTSWTWFCEPVECALKGPEDLGYIYGSCPTSEKICKTIINFPCTSLGDKVDKQANLLKIFENIVNY